MSLLPQTSIVYNSYPKLYFSPLALLPIVVDLVLLWGVFGQQWSAAAPRG